MYTTSKLDVSALVLIFSFLTIILYNQVDSVSNNINIYII
jgi:hypothetical protein